MSDLKEFLQDLRPKFICDNYDNRLFNNIQEELGLFFWERGGKQFVIECRKIYWNHKDRKNHYPSFDFLVCEAEKPLVANMFKDAQDFLDCLACLGGEKVKELIEELEGEGVEK